MNELQKILYDIQAIDKDMICIAIDGYCGSGKTTFAQKLQIETDGNLVHIDDFYLPFSQRKENWKEILAGNMDFSRLKEEILDRLDQSVIEYGIFNPHKQDIITKKTINKKKILILEGAYSHHEEIRKYFDYFIFFQCSDKKQRERLIQREGEHYEAFRNIWIKRERDYFTGFSIKENANIIVDTTSWF